MVRAHQLLTLDGDGTGVCIHGPSLAAAALVQSTEEGVGGLKPGGLAQNRKHFYCAQLTCYDVRVKAGIRESSTEVEMFIDIYCVLEAAFHGYRSYDDVLPFPAEILVELVGKVCEVATGTLLCLRPVRAEGGQHRPKRFACGATWFQGTRSCLNAGCTMPFDDKAMRDQIGRVPRGERARRLRARFGFAPGEMQTEGPRDD
jgi:hypothetical protein